MADKADKDMIVAKVSLVSSINPEASIEELTAEIQYYMVQMGQNAIAIGKRLVVAKEKLPHGEWQNWLEDNFNFSYRTAAQFMQMAERFQKCRQSALFSQSQMAEMLALPEAEAETEKFIERKAAEGTPVEKMKIRTLRAEVKKYNEELVAEKIEEVEVVENNSDDVIAEKLIKTQEKELPLEVLEVDVDSPKEEEQMSEETADEVADKAIEKSVEIIEASKSEEVLVDNNTQEKGEPVEVGMLTQFLKCLPTLLNEVNLQKAVEICASADLKGFEKQLSQLGAVNSELKNCLLVWKKQQDKNMSRKAIIAVLQQIAVAEEPPFEKSKFIRDSVEALGFKSVHNAPTKELLKILEKVKTQ